MKKIVQTQTDEMPALLNSFASSNTTSFLFLSQSERFLCICNTFRIKELGENACEEAQVAGEIICHGRWKRLHQGVYAKHSLKKLKVALEAVSELGVDLEGIVIKV